MEFPDSFLKMLGFFAKLASAPEKIRQIFAEANRREAIKEEAAKTDGSAGRIFDGPGSFLSMSATVEEVARERGVDIRAYMKTLFKDKKPES